MLPLVRRSFSHGPPPRGGGGWGKASVSLSPRGGGGGGNPPPPPPAAPSPMAFYEPQSSSPRRSPAYTRCGTFWRARFRTYEGNLLRLRARRPPVNYGPACGGR